MAKRGPQRPNAAQQDFLSARRPTVQPQQTPGKPNQFSASGASTQPPASASAGMSASGQSSIPTASAAGASASPTSLGMEPTGSSMMRRGGRVQRFAAGGATETDQYGSWGGANAANAVAGGAYTAPSGSASPVGGSATTQPFSTTAYTSPAFSSAAPTTAAPTAASSYGQISNGGGGFVGGAGAGSVATNGKYGVGYFGGNPGAAGYSQGMMAEGGSIEDPKSIPYRNKWKAKNHPGDKAYKFDDGGDVPSDGGDSSGGVPDPGGAMPTDPSDPSAMQDTPTGDPGQVGDLGASLQAVQNAYQYGMQQLAGNIPSAPAGPGGDQTQGGPQDRGNQVAGNIPTVPAGPGGDQTQGGGPQDRGQQMAANTSVPPGSQSSANGAPQWTGQGLPTPQPGVLQPTPPQFNPRDYLPGGSKASDAGQGQYTASAALGGSIPSFAPGGGVMPPMAPNPPTPPPTPAPGGVPPQPQVGPPQGAASGPGGVGGAPPNIMRYLTGADAAPVKQVLQRQKSMDPKIPPHARTAHMIASAGGPAQQFATLQAFRRLSDTAGIHAKVSLKGAGKHPPSLPHAVAFANKKFEYAPTPHHVQFNLKGKGAPTQGAFRGGSIQSFDDGGDVGPDVGMSSADDPSTQMADAGAPSQAPSSDQPVVMTVDGNSMDLSPAQLNGVSGISFDDLMQNAKQAIQKGMAAPDLDKNAEAGGIYGQPNLPQEQPSEFSQGAGSADNPDWNKIKRTGLQGPGSSSTSPGQDTPYEGQGVNPFHLPVANKDNVAAPVGQVTSSSLPPATEPINNTRDIPGTEIDANGVRSVTDPQAYDDFRKGLTNFDFNKESTQQGATPYSSQTGTPQTAGGPDEPTNSGVVGVNRFGIDSNINAQDRNRQIAAGAQNSAEMNQRIIQSTHDATAREIAARHEAAESPRAQMKAGGARAAPQRHAAPQRAAPQRRIHRGRHADLNTSQAAASGGSIQGKPRRVYGKGHAGLGTYQEKPDGSAQFLGPQRLTW